MASDENDDLHREHDQLLDQLATLQREHDALERQPYDRATHGQHQRKLALKRAELEAHLGKLKRRREQLRLP
jgi:hypothetical protein